MFHLGIIIKISTLSKHRQLVSLGLALHYKLTMPVSFISLFLSKILTIFLFLKPLRMLKVHVVHMVSDKYYQMTSDPRIGGLARLKVADQCQLVNKYVSIEQLPNYMPLLPIWLARIRKAKNLQLSVSHFSQNRKQLASNLAKNFVHNVKINAK